MLLPAHFLYSCKQHIIMYKYKIHAQSDLAFVFNVYSHGVDLLLVLSQNNQLCEHFHSYCVVYCRENSG
jgi:hypothetical protein